MERVSVLLFYCSTVLQVCSVTVAKLVFTVCYLVSPVSVSESKFDFEEACVICFATMEGLLTSIFTAEMDRIIFQTSKNYHTKSWWGTKMLRKWSQPFQESARRVRVHDWQSSYRNVMPHYAFGWFKDGLKEIYENFSNRTEISKIV